MSLSSPPPARHEPLECPHCEEPTMPNLLSDGTVVCSCAAERALPGLRPLAARPALPK